MPSQKIRFDTDGPMATITLNRPEKLNALDLEMLDALESLAAEIDRDESIRVVLLAAEGDRAFCVGADITVWAALEPMDMWRRWIRDGHRVFDRIATLRQPVVAALNGMAFGGGLELALAADLRVASESARFSVPEVKIGTLPGWGGTDRLRALIGPARAKQMVFTGAPVDANTALAWGLVNEVVPASDLIEASARLLREIAANAPVPVQLAKESIDAQSGAGRTRVLEGMAAGLAAHTDDAREGTASFKERRPPEFRGR